MKLLSLLIICSSITLQAQNIVISGNPIQKDSIIILDTTLKKDQLYSKGLEWFAINYKSSKNVIELQDKDAGLIIGKGSTYCFVKGGALLQDTKINLSYTVRLSFKDGKIKYDINQFIEENFGVIKDGEIIKSPVIGIMKKLYTGTKNNVYSEITMLEESILETFTKMKSTEW